MPILIKEFTWRQTEEILIVRVPTKNVNPIKVDLFTSDLYIKASFPPFLFEAFLFEAISEEESKCTLVNGEAVFELVKLEKKEWPTLQKELSKKEMISIKEEVIKRAHEIAEIKTKAKKEMKYDRHKDCVKRQIKFEDLKREKCEQLKKKDHDEAVMDIMKWKFSESYHDKSIESSDTKCDNVENNLKNEDKENDLAEEKTEEIKKKPLPSWLAAATKHVKRPPPRRKNVIKMDFTYRAFPTPCRESLLSAEEEWLKKQAEARRLSGFVAEDLRPEEKDPDWLLEKGKSFHAVGNYLGAVSAFTYAIKYWDKIPELYVARSETQVALGNWRRVLRDTSAGLELCRPHVPANENMRFKCYFNRALALIEIGRPRSAIGELEEALELRPFDERVHHLIDRAENEPQTQENLGDHLEPEDLAN